MFDPDRHAQLERRHVSLRVEAQAQCIAVMVADHPFGLPSGEGPERPQFGDDCFDRVRRIFAPNVKRLTGRYRPWVLSKWWTHAGSSDLIRTRLAGGNQPSTGISEKNQCESGGPHG